MLLYALGAGVARYLGNPLDWGIYLLGQAWVSVLQLGAHYLNEYYDAPADQDNPNRTALSGGSGKVGAVPRNLVFTAAAACLAVTASLSVLLIQTGRLSPAALAIMILAALVAVFYSTPPVRLVNSGYGELATSILVANLVPAFAFLLQVGELHPLVARATLPLTALHLAMMLAFELPDYANDMKHKKRTLMIRMGWESGMTVHNAMLLAAYLLLGASMLTGLPLALALPGFMTLPLAGLQIWQMRRIAEGARPNWRLLTLNAVAIFAASTYLLAFGFWTR